ncbi:hypothetical protein C0Q70_14329 [Pomacea canaliculata]|uniref:Uncharacterized protein n=1 Tax=Pomacea canaliculata TaxID=400727 RepID=A0A2T7NZQ3_POMCA|nr:hypothetical protein C0Q70_14329 [Pomacea canaliculata]
MEELDLMTTVRGGVCPVQVVVVVDGVDTVEERLVAGMKEGQSEAEDGVAVARPTSPVCTRGRGGRLLSRLD